MVKVRMKNFEQTRLEIAKTGRSLRKFSKDIGISQGYLSQILCGKKKPSPTIAYKISNGLGLQLDDIFFIHND